MTLALLHKEIRDLGPFFMIQGGVIALGIALMLLTGTTTSPIQDTFEAELAWAALYVPVALMIGTGVASREADDHTLGFLDGLPVSRGVVFIAKVLAAWLAATSGPVAGVLIDLVSYPLFASHLQADPHVDLVLGALALRCIGLCTTVLVGAAFGLLRSLTWPTFALAWSAVLALAQEVPRATALAPNAWMTVHLAGDHIDVPWEVLVVEATLGAACGLIAFTAFTLSGRLRPWEPGPLGKGMVVTGSFVALIGAIVLMAAWFEDPTSSNIGIPGTEDIELAMAPAAQATTDHYRFSYTADNAAEAASLARSADGVYNEVARLLDAPAGARIEVDTSGSKHNTAGTAFDGSIRLSLRSDADATLAHETSHVLSARMVGEAGHERWSDALVLNEGLAEWVEGQVRPDDAKAKARMRVLAALHARYDLDLDAIGDWAAFSTTHDDGLKYAIGAELIAALVEVGGKHAPGRVLTAFGDPTLPGDLRGLSAWQAAMQLAGIDLSAVLARLSSKIEDEEIISERWINALPRPRFTLVTDGEQTGVRADEVTLGEGSALWVRFQPRPGASVERFQERLMSPGEPLWVDASDIEGGQICAQMGVAPDSGPVIYEAVVCVPVSAAERLP